MVALYRCGRQALLAAGERGTVSVRLGPDAVAAVGPGDGSVKFAVDVGPSPSHLAAGARALWVTNADGHSVSRIDLHDRAVRQTVRVGNGPAGVAVAAGTSSSTRTVSQIDPRSGRVLEVIGVGGGPSGIAVTDRAVWVTNSLDGTVSRIDPATAVVVATIPVGNGPDSIAAGAGGNGSEGSSGTPSIASTPTATASSAGSRSVTTRRASRWPMARCGWGPGPRAPRRPTVYLHGRPACGQATAARLRSTTVSVSFSWQRNRPRSVCVSPSAWRIGRPGGATYGPQPKRRARGARR